MMEYLGEQDSQIVPGSCAEWKSTFDIFLIDHKRIDSFTAWSTIQGPLTDIAYHLSSKIPCENKASPSSPDLRRNMLSDMLASTTSGSLLREILFYLQNLFGANLIEEKITLSLNTNSLFRTVTVPVFSLGYQDNEQWYSICGFSRLITLLIQKPRICEDSTVACQYFRWPMEEWFTNLPTEISKTLFDKDTGLLHMKQKNPSDVEPGSTSLSSSSFTPSSSQLSIWHQSLASCRVSTSQSAAYSCYTKRPQRLGVWSCTRVLTQHTLTTGWWPISIPP